MRLRTWLCRWWPWLLGALVLIAVGMLAGWKLAGLLGIGLAGGSAAKQLEGNQRRRETEGKRLEQDRKDLQSEAKKTDAMIDQYYQRKGGPKR
jgi:hypothetical protein